MIDTVDGVRQSVPAVPRSVFGCLLVLSTVACQDLLATRSGSAKGMESEDATSSRSPATPNVSTTRLPPSRDLAGPRSDAARVLRASKLGRVAGELERALEPTIHIHASRATLASIATGASRFGGLPDVPAGFDWPRYRNRPAAFLAQIRLGDVAPLDAGKKLPAAGWLVFFYEIESGRWGFDPNDRGSARVVYFAPGSKLARATPPPDLPAPAKAFAPCALRFSAGMTLPDPASEFEKIPIDRDDDGAMDAYGELAGQLAWGPSGRAAVHHLLGHPQIIQNEMRTECQLASRGIDVGTPEGYRDARAEALLPGARDWRLLLQLDTDEVGPGWMWGDAGRLYFWIRQQDLRDRRFEQAWLILQCY